MLRLPASPVPHFLQYLQYQLPMSTRTVPLTTNTTFANIEPSRFPPTSNQEQQTRRLLPAVSSSQVDKSDVNQDLQEGGQELYSQIPAGISQQQTAFSYANHNVVNKQRSQAQTYKQQQQEQQQQNSVYFYNNQCAPNQATSDDYYPFEVSAHYPYSHSPQHFPHVVPPNHQPPGPLTATSALPHHQLGQDNNVPYHIQQHQRYNHHHHHHHQHQQQQQHDSTTRIPTNTLDQLRISGSRVILSQDIASSVSGVHGAANLTCSSSSVSDQMTFQSAELNLIAPAFAVEEDPAGFANFPAAAVGRQSSEINFFPGPYEQKYDYQLPSGPRNSFGREYDSYTTLPYQHHHHHHQTPNAIPLPMPGSVVNSRLDEYSDSPYRMQPLGNLGSSSSDPHISAQALLWAKSLGQNHYQQPSGCPSRAVHEHGSAEVMPSDSSCSQVYYGTDNVVQELSPEYVRWFYKSEGDRKWVAFTGYDSLRIETRHRELALEEENLASPSEIKSDYDSTENLEAGESGRLSTSSSSTTTKSRYKAYTRASWKDNNSGGQVGGVASSTGKMETLSASRIQWPPDPANPENIILVRGGLYEVNLEQLVCYATYWTDISAIRRGTWFYDGTWEPIDSAHADTLEIEHLERFGGTSVFSFETANVSAESLHQEALKKGMQVQHQISFPDFHVDWYSACEIHLCSKAVPHKLMRSVGQKLGFQTGIHRLCRGYYKQSVLSDRPPEINHIVFVIHGIGQKYDTGRIVRNCAAFRELIVQLRKQFYPDSERTNQRAEFFPVEWRSAAKLDGDIVDSITPHKLLGLRQMLNATAMDIMYYTSPLYRTDIQNALRSELNRIYANFVKRNPHFETRGGKVSVLAHSLGAVITFDIMTGYISPLRSDCPEMRSAEAAKSQEEVNHEGIVVIDDVTSDKVPEQPRLLFKLEHFFCLGSPLAVFLALRWKEPHNPDLRNYVLPSSLCKRIYNVFHPSDPVAYRVEPLLNKAYVKIAPLTIHSSGSTVPKYDEMERELISRETTTNSQAIALSKSKEMQPPTNLSPPPPDASFYTSTSMSQHRSSVARAASASVANFAASADGATWSWLNPLKLWRSPENVADGAGLPPTGGLANVNPLSPPPEPIVDHRGRPTHNTFLEHEDPDKYTEDKQNEGPDPSEDQEDLMAPILNDLDYRIDYVLRESNLSSSYLAALTSHTSYWSNPDVAYFVLAHLFNESLDSEVTQQ